MANQDNASGDVVSKNVLPFDPATYTHTVPPIIPYYKDFSDLVNENYTCRLGDFFTDCEVSAVCREHGQSRSFFVHRLVLQRSCEHFAYNLTPQAGRAVSRMEIEGDDNVNEVVTIILDISYTGNFNYERHQFLDLWTAFKFAHSNKMFTHQAAIFHGMTHHINQVVPHAYIMAEIRDFHHELYQRLVKYIRNPLEYAETVLSQISAQDKPTDLEVGLDALRRTMQTHTVICPGMRNVLLSYLNTLHKMCKAHINHDDAMHLAEVVIGTIGETLVTNGQKSEEFVKGSEELARQYKTECEATVPKKRSTSEENPMLRFYIKKARLEPPKP